MNNKGFSAILLIALILILGSLTFFLFNYFSDTSNTENQEKWVDGSPETYRNLTENQLETIAKNLFCRDS